MMKASAALKVVAQKELLDIRRDLKSIQVVFFLPVFMVLSFVATCLFMLSLSKSSQINLEQPLEIHVSGAQYFPELVQALSESAIKINNTQERATAATSSHQPIYTLEIPESAQSQFAQGRSVNIRLIYDGSKNRDQGALNRIRQAIWGLNQRVGQLRLLTRNVAPELINPIALQETNLANEEKMAGLFLGSIPLILIITAFLCSTGVSADLFAGEREKRTLEALLITSCPSSSIAIGKWLCTWWLTCIATTWQLVLLSCAVGALPLSQLGIRVDIDVSDWLIIWLSLLNLGAFACSLQVFISLHARNFKDAQMLISLMAAIPVVALGYNLYKPDFYAAWFDWAPIISHHLIIKTLMGGQTISVATWVESALTTIAPCACILYLAQKRLRAARVIYGRKA